MILYRAEPLTDRHVLDDFRCGKPMLDEWLVRHAKESVRRRNTLTHVWTRARSVRAVAYFAFAPHLVVKKTLPRRLAHGAQDAVPAILLAKLALHVDLAGQRLGRHLLLDAFEVCLEAANLIGGRFLIVDAIDDEAASWYEHRGFLRVPGCSRLFLKMSTVEATVRR